MVGCGGDGRTLQYFGIAARLPAADLREGETSERLAVGSMPMAQPEDFVCLPGLFLRMDWIRPQLPELHRRVVRRVDWDELVSILPLGFGFCEAKGATIVG